MLKGDGGASTCFYLTCTIVSILLSHNPNFQELNIHYETAIKHFWLLNKQAVTPQFLHNTQAESY